MKLTILAALLSLVGSVAFADTVAPLQQIMVNNQTILATSAGLTVYTYDPDTTTASNCNGGCAKAWPPVVATADMQIQTPLGTVTRQDGSVQLTYNQHPLSTYVGDAKQGDVTGDGLGGVWHIVVDNN